MGVASRFSRRLVRRAQTSQSPVYAEEDGDGTSMVFRIPESLVNIAQILK
jgi:hypothetical protein